MKITFLGTGAADWPMEKPKDGGEFRRLSSALIDDSLLIDPGPQVMEALQEFGKDPAKIRFILNTHRHGDHYCEDTVCALCAAGASFVPLSAGDEAVLGKYTVRAFAANHDTCQGSVHFFLSDGEKCLFYGLDGAWLRLDEFRAMMEYRPDLAVLDGTVGWTFGDLRIFEHNNLHMVLEMKKTLDPYVKQICISHMAMTLHTDHQTLEADMMARGVIAAYDGKEILI